MAYNNAINSGDPQAVEKLTARLEKCKKAQAYMKDVNAYYRKFGTCKGFPDMTDTTAVKLDAHVGSRSWVTQPFDYTPTRPAATLPTAKSSGWRAESKQSPAIRRSAFPAGSLRVAEPKPTPT